MSAATAPDGSSCARWSPRRAQTPSITILEGFEARRLLVEDNAVRGVSPCGPSEPALFATDRVVIATGGIGGLYAESTNPLGSFGQGLALAARAGAVLADMEFVQFHPTALDVPLRPMPLVSEAVRGEGAKLIDERGERFMAGFRAPSLRRATSSPARFGVCASQAAAPSSTRERRSATDSRRAFRRSRRPAAPQA